MLRYILRRLVLLPLLMFILSALIFSLVMFLSPYERLAVFIPNADAVKSTINSLVKSSQLSEQIASEIDIASITSFFDSQLGQLALEAGDNVLREWPFTYALDAAVVGADSADEVVVMQGIIDMVIPTDDGLVIVDFKTDRVSGDAINERAEKYATQLQHYAKAAGDILKQPVTAAWLYFIRPAKAVQVKL